MIKEYKTVRKEAAFELEVKRSRFVACVKPVKTEEEARNFIDLIRTRSRDASHNVYAYDISGETVIQRYSDDGEPQGTAGIPVMEVIKRNELKNLTIVVTRYFGGILLGASGLARAYGKSAWGCIETAGIVKRILCVMYRISLDYRYLGKLQGELAGKGFEISGMNYTDSIDMSVAVNTERESLFLEIVNDVTSGNAALCRGGHVYVDFPW